VCLSKSASSQCMPFLRLACRQEEANLLQQALHGPLLRPPKVMLAHLLHASGASHCTATGQHSGVDLGVCNPSSDMPAACLPAFFTAPLPRTPVTPPSSAEGPPLQFRLHWHRSHQQRAPRREALAPRAPVQRGAQMRASHAQAPPQPPARRATARTHRPTGRPRGPRLAKTHGKVT